MNQFEFTFFAILFRKETTRATLATPSTMLRLSLFWLTVFASISVNASSNATVNASVTTTATPMVTNKSTNATATVATTTSSTGPTVNASVTTTATSVATTTPPSGNASGHSPTPSPATPSSGNASGHSPTPSIQINITNGGGGHGMSPTPSIQTNITGLPIVPGDIWKDNKNYTGRNAVITNINGIMITWNWLDDGGQKTRSIQIFTRDLVFHKRGIRVGDRVSNSVAFNNSNFDQLVNGIVMELFFKNRTLRIRVDGNEYSASMFRVLTEEAPPSHGFQVGGMSPTPSIQTNITNGGGGHGMSPTPSIQNNLTNGGGGHGMSPTPSIQTNITGGGGGHGMSPTPSFQTNITGGGGGLGMSPTPSIQINITNGGGGHGQSRSHGMSPTPSIQTNGGGGGHGMSPTPSLQTNLSNGGGGHGMNPTPSAHQPPHSSGGPGSGHSPGHLGSPTPQSSGGSHVGSPPSPHSGGGGHGTHAPTPYSGLQPPPAPTVSPETLKRIEEENKKIAEEREKEEQRAAEEARKASSDILNRTDISKDEKEKLARDESKRAMETSMNKTVSNEEFILLRKEAAIEDFGAKMEECVKSKSVSECKEVAKETLKVSLGKTHVEDSEVQEFIEIAAQRAVQKKMKVCMTTANNITSAPNRQAAITACSTNSAASPTMAQPLRRAKRMPQFF